MKQNAECPYIPYVIYRNNSNFYLLVMSTLVIEYRLQKRVITSGKQAEAPASGLHRVSMQYTITMPIQNIPTLQQIQHADALTEM